MNDYFEKEEVSSCFDILNKANINYILLRNINNELPEKLLRTKDIDIIVHKDNLQLLHEIFLLNGWKQIRHPYYKTPFLYAMTPFRFYDKNGLHIDISCELSCRSLNDGEWFPLHQKIQDDIWLNKVDIKSKPWKYELSSEDEFIHLITRCIFDKKKFSKEYILRIDFLFNKIDLEITLSKLHLIFYNFSNKLIDMISAKEYNYLPKTYITYKDY